MNIYSFIQQNKTLKIISWIVLTILLSAIGSGIWERFLSHGLEKVTDNILFAMSYIFHGYVDILHKSIGEGNINRMSVIPAIFLMLFAILTTWFLFIIFFKINKPCSNIESKNEGKKFTYKRKLLIYLLMSIVTTIMYTDLLIEESYNRKACIFVERSLDILAPYLDTKTLLTMRAEYRSVDNANKFYVLEAKLQGLAAKNKVELPKFTVIK